MKLWLQAVFTARLSVTSVGTGNRETPCVKPAAGASACLGLAGQRGHSCFRPDGTSLDVEQRIIYSKCAPTCAATDLSLWRSPCGASPVLDTPVQGLWPGPVRAPHHEPRGRFCTPIVRGTFFRSDSDPTHVAPDLLGDKQVLAGFPHSL